MPAVFGATVIVVALTLALVRRSAARRIGGDGRVSRAAQSAARLTATLGEGVRDALRLLRARDPRLLGAVGWWAFDVAVLWACLQAFGGAPPAAIVVTAYFVGMLGNLLPLPGGVGGVDGGMIAALIGFGVDEGLAIVGVLVYRGFAFWLPIVPGAIAYVQLLRTVGHARDGERAHGASG